MWPINKKDKTHLGDTEADAYNKKLAEERREMAKEALKLLNEYNSKFPKGSEINVLGNRCIVDYLYMDNPLNIKAKLIYVDCNNNFNSYVFGIETLVNAGSNT